MISVIDLSLSFQGQKLFDDVNLSFTPGNCYGVIGANGAGKSTFLKILEGRLEPDTGSVSIKPNTRMSFLEQDHFKFEDEKVIDVVIMGNARLMEIIREKEAIYAKEDFSDEDGILASELEAEFADMDGWSAEANASALLQGLGIGTELHEKKMSELSGKEKVKVLLAKALFGNPEILILDEPTNDLDIKSILWLENFLMDYEGTVIVVSHDRYFLNNICTHMVDIDFKKIKIFVGNYDFWYESSQLAAQMLKDQNKKKEDKIKELQNFIARFSANKSKSKQATSRKKLLDKIQIEDIQPSTRRYPFVGFEMEREVGNQILEVNEISKTIEGRLVLDKVSFMVNKNDKIGFIGDELAITTLFKILSGEMEADSGSFKWGVTTSKSYFPKDNTEFFKDTPYNLIDWLRQYSTEQSEIYIRGFLGRMLFSGDEALKPAQKLSGGEKVRMMLSYMMLKNSNVLILDQPTNHLDLESIISLNNGLKAFKGNILFASHDTEFMNTIANRIIHIEENVFEDRLMTYQEYIDRFVEGQ
ncbi:ABC-F family ATP-binding cassette domain-containing protein [Parvimonas micra]|uniref:ABC-F family ATP-binding cassette domain-containing protein n=1 Tax=Parvimonas micra TaxID=33033 RepID=UPI0020067F66|nr:ATP-binding cassette domain-containing protein [Parvimonas micra]MCK6130260.1 ATP-binding cassette domain-containing protein [Parvimonas micra]MCK6135906.1 ATP-binding cassette domain-containing protein [Parvimonas micra]MCK6137378.1 ATP-binding cassette domain-containing protein [Parvimonas micra]MCK6153905.1 ATP-binding cassette domain-containing protein [Parvimonas micra]